MTTWMVSINDRFFCLVPMFRPLCFEDNEDPFPSSKRSRPTISKKGDRGKRRRRAEKKHVTTVEDRKKKEKNFISVFFFFFLDSRGFFSRGFNENNPNSHAFNPHVAKP